MSLTLYFSSNLYNLLLSLRLIRIVVIFKIIDGYNCALRKKSTVLQSKLGFNKH